MAAGKRELPVLSTRGALKPFMTLGCSGAAFELLNRGFGERLGPEERAAAYLAGGILTNGYQCGQVWGAALAAGAKAYRRFGAGPVAETAAVEASRRLVIRFREQNGAVDCYDLTDTDWQKRWQMLRYMLRGKPIGCYRMLRVAVPAAFDVIAEALGDLPSSADDAPAPLDDAPAPVDDGPAALPPTPTSCAAIMARRLGLSEPQVIMAAGLAGGIGLSGGGCGALGVAVWAVGLEDAEFDAAIDFQSPRAKAVIDRFLHASDYDFECSSIVGRTFDDLPDHAAHLASGGCALLMDALVEDR